MIDRTNLPLLVTLALGVFAGALDLGVLSPALPALAHTFAIPGRDVAWVFTLYLFANVVSIPVMTKLSDVYGRRPIYIACVATFVAGSVFAIAAPTFAVFLVARAIQAVGAGGIFPVAAAAIADRVPLERRGSALGLLGAVWGLAAIVGPTFGGVVTHFVSWRWIFAANVPLGLIVIVRSRSHVPAAAARTRGPLDVAGLALLAFGLLAVMIGLTRLDATAPALGGNALTLAAVAVALIAFAALIPVERAAREPVISPALFGTRQLVVTYTLEVLIGMLESALFFVPAALVATQHLSYALAGIVAAVGAVVFVAVIPLAGRALDLYGSRIVLMAGAVYCRRPRSARRDASIAAACASLDGSGGSRLWRTTGCPHALHHHRRGPGEHARDGRGTPQHLSHYRPDLRRFACRWGRRTQHLQPSGVPRALSDLRRHRVARDVRYEPAGAARARAFAHEHGLIRLRAGGAAH